MNAALHLLVMVAGDVAGIMCMMDEQVAAWYISDDACGPPEISGAVYNSQGLSQFQHQLLLTSVNNTGVV